METMALKEQRVHRERLVPLDFQVTSASCASVDPPHSRSSWHPSGLMTTRPQVLPAPQAHQEFQERRESQVCILTFLILQHSWQVCQYNTKCGMFCSCH